MTTKTVYTYHPENYLTLDDAKRIVKKERKQKRTKFVKSIEENLFPPLMMAIGFVVLLSLYFLGF